MSWAIGYDNNWQRDIGYGVPATCDHPECNTQINRGLSHVCCNSEPYGGDDGCGLYFCGKHLHLPYAMCDRCIDQDPPFDMKPDATEWLRHKLEDDSWGKWREDNPIETIGIGLEIEGDI